MGRYAEAAYSGHQALFSVCPSVSHGQDSGKV